MARTTKERRVRWTVAGILGAVMLLGTARLVAAGELAPWMTNPALGARRDAFGPGVHMDATGGVYRDSVPDAWVFPPFTPDAYGPGLGSEARGGSWCRSVPRVPTMSEPPGHDGRET